MNILIAAALIAWSPWWCPWCHHPTPTPTPRPTPSPTPTATPSGKGLGIGYLLKSYDGTPYDLTNDPCWTNAVSEYVAVRTQWAALEPQDGTYNWAFTDQAASLAIQHQKKWSLLVTAGVTSPSWLKDEGALGMMVDTGGGVRMWMPMPWDTKFQDKWSGFVHALANRYGNNIYLTYIVMGGFGRRAESYFVTTQSDINTFHALGGLPKWEQGAEWCIDLYASAFINNAFILDLGSPEPDTAGQSALQGVCDYGAAHYPGAFGVKSDGLAASYPPNSIGATEVKKLSPTSEVGYQFSLPQKGNTTAMQEGLDNAVKYGAHFVEVYSGDCTDPVEQGILQTYNSILLR